MQMRIGGKEVDAGRKGWIPVHNPATGELIDHVPDGMAEDVEQAVAAAESAFEAWAGKTPRERGVVLLHAANQVRSVYRETARILTMEQGKPLKEAEDEIRGFANILEFYASIAGTLHGQAVPLGNTGNLVVIREPLGVCGAIIPWNVPAILMGWKCGPALLSGNTLILKPSSTTPLTTLRLAALMEHAGLSPGVLNVVTGRGETAGLEIVKHPAIRKVSFTGSTVTGHQIREAAGTSLKELTLELGGSDPMIVWRDAPIEKAVDGAIRGRFYNAGQTCTAVKRLYLHEEIADHFLSLLTARIQQLRVGNGLEPGVDMGPLHRMDQRVHTASSVDWVREHKAGRILAGGDILSGEGFDNGFYYAPTLIADPVPEAPLLHEEVFGPVLPVVRFGDLDSAIEAANSTRYGLGASVWTKDMDIVRAVFTRVRSGVCWVNRHLTLPPEVPFGGVKESGVGRENGVDACLAYTRTRSLIIGW
ncbi:MAG: aldehyde dehydrogenase family protein [Methanoregulaceae archaeon]|nr:aldehyde dehydrogenase family protein [Methanoregulaceae archaeon]